MTEANRTFTFGYDVANNLKTVKDVAANNTVTYTHDNADRLTGVTNPTATSESYNYDPVGNRNSSHLSASYGYQANNKLVSTSSASYSYDGNGDTLSKTATGGNLTYEWDYENRLKKATKPTGETVSYKYDALGRRITREKQTLPVLPLVLPTVDTTNFVYDGLDVVQDRNGTAGLVTASYLNGLGIDNKLRQTVNGQTQHFLADHLGSTNGLTDVLGNVASSASYDSFGNSTNALGTRYQYTGREFDSDIGLYYYRARFYHANLGRFISEDPIGLAGRDVNLYGYVRNNSINRKDPTGLIDLSYGSPTGPSTPLSYLPPNPRIADPIFGDGGYLSAPTLSEFISANERSKRKCKSTWFQRFWNNGYETNAALPGLGVPSLFPGLGIGALTSRATADALGVQTFSRWALSGLGGSVSGAATFTSLETGIGVAVGSLSNALLVNASYEAGVGVGSAVNATFGFSDYCPCGQ